MKVVLHGLMLCLALLSLSSCGGGGGGGDDEFVGAAVATVSVSPSSIDTGDRTMVTTELSQVDESGIILKFKYSDGLAYVISSAKLIIDDQEIDISPSTNAASASSTFLVFFLSRDLFGTEAQGTVIFQLEGQTTVINGKIEVDPDVDDPLIDNTVEFNIDTPEFGAEDSTEIEVT